MTKITFMRASYGSLESLLNYLKGSLIKDPFFTADKDYTVTSTRINLPLITEACVKRC